MDLAKTQFLFGRGGYCTTLRTFKRRRKLALLDKSGKPLRLIDMKQWNGLKTTWPDHVKSEGLSVRNVWVLEEDK